MVCAEGKTDIGSQKEWDSKNKTMLKSEGWVQPLVRSITGEASITFEIKRRGELTLFKPLKSIPNGVSGHGKKAFIAKAAAVREECGILIYMVDADDTSPRRHKEIASEIIAGFDAFSDPSVGCVACIPVSASEAWMLADKQAWNALTGAVVENLPGNPEQIWGEKDDPNSNRPHNYFARICQQESVEDCSDTRAQLAALIDPALLRATCPLSFPPFADMLLAPRVS